MTKKIEAIMRFGNLYDLHSKKRVMIEDGATMTIDLDEKAILLEDPNLEIPEFLGAPAKDEDVNIWCSKQKNVRSWKLLPAGTLLYVKIGAGVKKSEKKSDAYYRCLFEVELKEDLYISNSRDDVNWARFYKCACHVRACLSNFEYFEPLYAKSLNDAYTKTYELYFAMFGKSTCNAFDRFFLDKEMKTVIRDKANEIQLKPDGGKDKTQYVLL